MKTEHQANEALAAERAARAAAIRQSLKTQEQLAKARELLARRKAA